MRRRKVVDFVLSPGAGPRYFRHVSGAARSGFQLRGLVLESRDGFGHRSCLQERHLIERTVSHVSAGYICGSSTFCTLTKR
jgi:hypothetical protein